MNQDLQISVCCQVFIAEGTNKSVTLRKVLVLIFCIREFLGSPPETGEPGCAFVYVLRDKMG
jgi:hypothetical protein